MLNLLGEFDCTMDAKGRVRLPSSLIKQLGERASYDFVLTKGFEKCLNLYPKEIWDKKAEKYHALNEYDTDTRTFLRRLSNGITALELDEQGRILISKRLSEYANLEKDIILNAFGDKIEIWSIENYEAFMNDDSISMAELSQRVLGNRNE